MLTDNTVREQAYALWEQDGRPAGDPARYWLQAERDLLTLNVPVLTKGPRTTAKVKAAADKTPVKAPRRLKAVA